MVEVFKTNVDDEADATILVNSIQQAFARYTVKFDLTDCDRILRVKCDKECIQSAAILSILHQAGHWAEVLADIPYGKIMHA